MLGDSAPTTAALFLTIGAVIGGIARAWIDRLVPPPPGARSGWSAIVATALLFAAFACAVIHGQCQDTPEVLPGETWTLVRLAYHLVLIALLVTATGTDLRDYVIPDQITLTGMAIGLIGAAAFGHVQLAHVWVDWNQEIPGLHGPFIPAWLDAHKHLHGLAWSAAGLVAGAGVTWLVRAAAGLILGQPAMGFGDVTLMAMIGSFVGWQPVIVAFLLAPICGIVVALAVRFVTGRKFLPFGPYLAAAAVIVLFTWRWIWMFEARAGTTRLSVRLLFGDVPSLLILGGIAIASLVGLLVLLRLYRAIPVDRAQIAAEPANVPESGEPTTEPEESGEQGV